MRGHEFAAARTPKNRRAAARSHRRRHYRPTRTHAARCQPAATGEVVGANFIKPSTGASVWPIAHGAMRDRLGGCDEETDFGSVACLEPHGGRSVGPTKRA